MIRQQILALMALALVLAGGAHATSMVDINLEQTVSYAESGFKATVLSVEPVETVLGPGEQITVQIDEAVFGPVTAGKEYQWVQARGDAETPIPGMPQFDVGRQYVVFLAGKAEGSPFQAPIGLGQGTFTCHIDTATSQVLVMNEFRNRTLFMGLDAKAVRQAGAKARADKAGSAGGSPVADEQGSSTATQRLRRGGAIGLDTLLGAAAVLKATPDAQQKFKAAPPAPRRAEAPK